MGSKLCWKNESFDAYLLLWSYAHFEWRCQQEAILLFGFMSSVMGQNGHLMVKSMSSGKKIQQRAA